MITQEYLKECLEYNSETGVFIWKERPREHFKTDKGWKTTNTRLAGKIAGGLTKEGYIRIRINWKPYFAHRLAWFYNYGKWPKEQLDHINNIREDNRIFNIRECTNQQNGQNRRHPQSNNATGVLGVSFRKDRGKFRASIRFEGKDIHIGYFLTSDEAHAAYIIKKRELHPFGTI